MHIILIPGFWLDASSWDEIVPTLSAAGHVPHALTLPGADVDEPARSKVTLNDQVEAVVAVVDGIDPTERVLLVGHSGGGAVAHAVTDARPDRIARVVYLASEPVGDGHCVNDELPVVDGQVPLPDWSFFDEEMLAGLDDDLRAGFRARAIPVPVHVAQDSQRLSDERRYDVPITVICCEWPAEMLRAWIAEGHPAAAELGRIRDVTYVDLQTGHWPQLTRPTETAALIVAAAEAATS